MRTLRFPDPGPQMRPVALDEFPESELPEVISEVAGSAAHEIWRTALDELPMRDGANPTRFLRRTAAVVDAAIAEERRRVATRAGVVMTVYAIALFAIVAMTSAGAKW